MIAPTCEPFARRALPRRKARRRRGLSLQTKNLQSVGAIRCAQPDRTDLDRSSPTVEWSAAQGAYRLAAAAFAVLTDLDSASSPAAWPTICPGAVAASGARARRPPPLEAGRDVVGARPVRIGACRSDRVELCATPTPACGQSWTRRVRPSRRQRALPALVGRVRSATSSRRHPPAVLVPSVTTRARGPATRPSAYADLPGLQSGRPERSDPRRAASKKKSPRQSTGRALIASKLRGHPAATGMLVPHTPTIRAGAAGDVPVLGLLPPRRGRFLDSRGRLKPSQRATAGAAACA